MNKNILKMARHFIRIADENDEAQITDELGLGTGESLARAQRHVNDSNPLKHADFTASPFWVMDCTDVPRKAVAINTAEELAEFILNGDWEALK